MTSSGKIRVYELSKDLGLENKDVLDAALKLNIAVKSHSSSINDLEAKKIRNHLLNKNAPKTKPSPEKTILSLKKASTQTNKESHSDSKKKEEKKGNLKTPPTISTPISPIKPVKPQLISSKPQTANKPIKPTEAIKTPEKIVKTTKSLISPPSSPSPPLKPKSPNRPTLGEKPSFPKRTDQIQKNQGITSSRDPGSSRNSSFQKKNTPHSRPQIHSEKTGPSQELYSKPQQKGPNSQQNRQQGQERRRPNFNQRPPLPSNQRNNFNNRQGTSQRPNTPTNNAPQRTGRPRPASNPVELVGKPIRRDKSSGSNLNRPGKNRQSPSQNHQGFPPGMRKPVAPGELMQLQKPNGNPSSKNGPKRQGEGTTKDGANPPNNRSSQATKAPQRPSHRPPGSRPAGARPPGARPPGARPPGSAGSARRTGRPDWDDSAKLDAIRSKSNQKQRQKVHIIGENDDALTTETSGFAGEKQAVVLSASLARPAKPKSGKKSTNKPVTALRKRKKETTRQRQRRRSMELRAAREAKQVRPEMIIVPEENLTVQELADMLSVESSEIIKSLFFKGITATVTQSLDLPTIETVAEEFGVPVLQDDVEEAAKKTTEMIEEADLEHLIRRPPVVTVMGHVDHGKTSLLDAIRKARVAAGEAGGITQHIGAYQVDVDHGGETKKITFLDTPGHEAFTAMRARGTKVTDVAILVVAADDGVRPQTLEAISHARAAKVPIIVAINKIDKEGASPDKVKQELSEHDLIAEEWGGEVVMVPVSAVKGENIERLLEMILLVTEVEDLQANPDRLAKGTVIEAHLDKAKGPVATLLIQNGTLKAGDVLAAGPVLGKVRAMVDENGIRLKESGPSCPVEALGFSEVPTAGDEFEVYPDEKAARLVVGERASDARATRLAQQMASRRVSLSSMSGQASEGDLKELNLVLKADVQGSIEAILGALEQLPKDEVQVRVLLSAPGEISETDIDLAAASGAVIIGFNTSMASGARRAADTNNVDVREYEVIYKLLEDIQFAMEGLLEPEMVQETIGQAEVRAIFTIGKSAVAGCYVTNGKLQRNCKVRVGRGKEIVFEGDLDSLRRNKDDIKEVATGFECGIGCDRFANWEEGDLIEAYKLVTQKRKLSI